MKPTALVVFLLLLPILPIAAQSGTNTQSATKTKRRSSTASQGARKAPATATADQVKALQDALAAQDRRIQQLEQQLQQRDQATQQVQSQLQRTEAAATEAQAKVAQIQSSSSQQQESFTKLQGDMNDFRTSLSAHAVTTQEEQKRLSALQSLVGRLRLTGDVRVRQEDFFLEGQNARIRQRVRLRLGVDAPLGDDFTAGVAFASGTLADPTSTNDTLTNFFERKVVGWDRGYVTYNPKAHKWLSLTGGKFAFNWQKTNQTFDPDINPEGFSEKISFDIKNNFLKNVTFNGIQMFFFENSNTRFGVDGHDSFAAGGQMLLKVQPHKRWTITPSYTVLNWRNEGILLNAPAFSGAFPVSGTTNIVCNPVTALNTSPSCTFATVPFAPNGMTNAYRVTSRASNGNIVRAYLSKFLYSDLIVENKIDTGVKRWPWRVMLEYEENLRAATNNSHMYQVETSFGQTSNKNDVLVGYAFLRQEQDSVIASFGESDQRLPTNVLAHKAYFQYKFRPKVTLGYTIFIGRVLNSRLFAAVPIPGSTSTDALQPGFLAPGVTPGQIDKYLKRMQFDVIYSF
jgi:hypothetical protein